MEINQLIVTVKNKIEKSIIVENIIIEDKTFLHKKHTSHKMGRYHLKLKIKSLELKKFNKIESTKKIYAILENELKNHIHSIQILIE